MAAFSYQHPTFLHDSLFLPSTPIKMSGLFEEGYLNTSSSSFFPYSFPSQPFQDIPIDVKVLESNYIGSSVSDKHKTDSSSMVIDLEGSDQVTQKETPVEKKRKNRDGSCLTSAQSKDPKKAKAWKQSKCIDSLNETEEKKKKAGKKNQKKVPENPSTGYVHVRAKRGEATDSHSLAERVRRERISERFKMLQGLVPGCDMVTSKALMLDEIINYVQSLQHQVEFLSMKLASVSPMFYDFRVDLGSFMLKSEKFPYVKQSIPTPITSLADITTTLTTTNNYPLQDSSVSFLLQQGNLVPNAISQGENLLWDLEDQRQRLVNQADFTTLCSSSSKLI